MIVPVGPESIVVFGAAVSTVNVRVAGVGSTLPARVAGADRERVRALGQVRVRLRRRARRERRAVQAALERRARLGRRERERRRRVVGRAGRTARDGGVRERRLDRERARGGRRRPRCRRRRWRGPGTCTCRRPAGRACAARCSSRTCRSPSPARRGGTRSSSPVSLEENANCGEAVLIVPVGPESIVVSGATVSTVNVRVAGVGSTLPAASIARDRERVRAVASGSCRSAARCTARTPRRPAGTRTWTPVSVPENVNDAAWC